jgi:hypothetical protein
MKCWLWVLESSQHKLLVGAKTRSLLNNGSLMFNGGQV